MILYKRDALINVILFMYFIIFCSGVLEKVIANSYVNLSDKSYIFFSRWGFEGFGDGQFKEPTGIAIDDDGNIYVADSGNKRIQKFDSNGNFITKFGIEGSGDGQFEKPLKLAIDSGGNVYVADYINSNIQKFNSIGKFLIKWGTYGDSLKKINKGPLDITIDSKGFICAICDGSFRKYDSNGVFIIIEYCNPSASIVTDLSDCTYLINYTMIDAYGRPTGTSNIISGYSMKYFNFTPINKWKGKDKKITGIISSDGIPVIAELAVDVEDNVYVLECANSCIQKFDSNGNFITEFGSKGNGDGEFNNPLDIAVDREGNVYVVDSGNNRIQKFAPNPEFKPEK